MGECNLHALSIDIQSLLTFNFPDRYAQNGNIFSKRMGAIRKSCGKDVELVFIDGPHLLQPGDLAWSSTSELGASEASGSDPAIAFRAWWRVNTERTQALGLDASLALLKDVLKADRYEGVFGFSQGAAFAALLAALLEKPHLYPSFLIDGQSPHPPFKFCVSVSGFKPPDQLATILMSPSYSTPTLHVLGKNDVIVIEEWSKVLLEISANKRIEEHDGGHFVPCKANWRNFFRDYLLDPLRDVPSPGLSSSSTPNFGATYAQSLEYTGINIPRNTVNGVSSTKQRARIFETFSAPPT
ncbi:hypothetical protein PILCRDRAFT_798693 [Piloderma croceum F 1598]|uniref:Serine hydrolase domain-containing protein n=1 Tax=Piloderma croceum (strain F 1598) TaxID=765440 RepID=A0A0C3ET27_PILCF|nr:hypothetical protein PILCRDRAFT_798693 [Piloderma croceum F 1598]